MKIPKFNGVGIYSGDKLTNMGLFQSTHIVGTVTAHERGVSKSPKARKCELLLRRRYTREYFGFGQYAAE